MIRTLILYESKNEFTEMIAYRLSLVLGPAKYSRMYEFNGNTNDFECLIICVPDYTKSIEDEIIKYVSENAEWIKQKKVMLISTCLEENTAKEYLKSLKNILGESVVFQCSINNEMLKNDKFNELALKIKRVKDMGKKIIEKQMLKTYIDDFIKNHNTCALATCYEDKVRATPIEYVFMDDCLYILSEGGEKFINLLNNPNVSACIYDPFKDMKELAGMQITGVSEIINIESDEYKAVIKQRGLNYNSITSLPIPLNLIKINIKMIEFLWSGFSKLGYDTKQIYYKI